jgi:hypothetical protein
MSVDLLTGRWGGGPRRSRATWCGCVQGTAWQDGDKRPRAVRDGQYRPPRHAWLAAAHGRVRGRESKRSYNRPLLGHTSLSLRMFRCDALLLVGTSFPYCENLPAPGRAKSVHIDLSASQVGLRYSSTVNLVGGAKETLQVHISYTLSRCLLDSYFRPCCRFSTEMPTQRGGDREWRRWRARAGTR